MTYNLRRTDRTRRTIKWATRHYEQEFSPVPLAGFVTTEGDVYVLALPVTPILLGSRQLFGPMLLALTTLWSSSPGVLISTSPFHLVDFIHYGMSTRCEKTTPQQEQQHDNEICKIRDSAQTKRY